MEKEPVVNRKTSNRVRQEKHSVKGRGMALGILQKYLIVTISLLVLSILVSSIFFLLQIRKIIRVEETTRLETLSSSLAQNSKEMMLSWDYPLLKKACTDVLKEEGIVYITIYDDQGRIIGDSDYARVGKTERELFNNIINHDYSKVDPFTRRIEKDYFISKTKFYNKEALEVRRLLRIEERIIGALVMGASQERMVRLVRRVTLQILLISIGVLILGIIVAVIFVRTLIKPIRLLHLGAQKIGAGDLQHRINVKAGDEIGVLADAFNDMTEKLIFVIQKMEKQNLELKELDRLKSEFLANTSHELRTPLNGIIGLVESILDGADGPISNEQKRHLQMVNKCSISLLELVNNLLDLSKLEAGLMEFDVQKFNLKDVIGTVIPIAEGLARDKKDVKVKVEWH